MPANTPIYGFTYPCETEPVSFVNFQTLANQIDTRLASIQLDENYATGRYNVKQTAADQAAIVSGVETPLVNAGSTYVIPADGVYWVSARVRLQAATSLSSSRLRVRLNAVPLFGQSFNTTAPLFNGPMIAVGTMNAVTGDTISMSILFTGVGAGTATLTRLDVRQLVRTF